MNQVWIARYRQSGSWFTAVCDLYHEIAHGVSPIVFIGMVGRRGRFGGRKEGARPIPRHGGQAPYRDGMARIASDVAARGFGLAESAARKDGGLKPTLQTHAVRAFALDGRRSVMDTEL